MLLLRFGDNGKIFMRRKGFTLIEVIVVAVIITIVASIAAPNFANIIKRNLMRDIVSTARWTEDATMALTGLQYARTDSGNPLFVPTSAPGDRFWIDENAEGEQYIYVIDDKPYGAGGESLFRAAPANIASQASRKSAGINEIYKRTMNDLPEPDWRNTLTFEDRVTCSVYFSLNGSNIQGSGTNLSVKPGEFAKYKFVYSEYYGTFNNRQMAIFHGARLHSAGADPGVAAGALQLDPPDNPGWHIYEMTGGTLYYYGSI